MTISEDKRRVDQVVRGALAQNRGFAIEFQITRANGDRRTLRAISDGPLNDDEGKRSRMFGTLQDITEEKRAQVETCARQKVETVVTLAGGIAHDFNNLLGSALAQAELGLGELEAGFSPKDELQAIRDVAIRGSEIVRQLMVYTGKESAAVEPLNVSTVIKEMLQLLKVSVSKHAVIEVMLDEDLPTVWANAPQLRQIVMNLVINASEAIGDGDGVIRVSTKRETADANSSDGIREPLGAHPYVRLSVSDTGHGMSPEIQSKVFDPFFTTKSTGHGVGLATTHGIVRSLGGTIRLMSEPGKGTTFHIMLPCNETQPQSTQRSRALVQQPARQAPATVLVVEDEDSLRQAVSKLLVRNGFEVVEAADGSMAIAILHANQDRLDAILLDATLPGVSSKEIVAEVATIRPDTKVILTSAYSQEMLLTGINGQQIHGFVRKPYQLGDLMKTLSDVLCV
jgi:signal transduction histidine kinase/CheY-like chemotaxis protein